MLTTIKTKEKILLYSNNLWMMGEGMLGPLVAVFTQRLGGSVLDISLAWSIYLIVGGLMHIIVGKWCDRWHNLEKVALLGYALNALFTFAYLLVDSPTKLFLVQAGLGLAVAIANPPWFALYARYEDKHHDANAWGILRGESLIITGIAMLLGGVIVERFGFQALFILMGFFQVLATIYQAKLLKQQS